MVFFFFSLSDQVQILVVGIKPSLDYSHTVTMGVAYALSAGWRPGKEWMEPQQLGNLGTDREDVEKQK